MKGMNLQMKETLINKKTITYGEDFLSEMEICYILTEGECPVGVSKFGVRLIKETIENGARVCEDNTTPALFSNRGEALDFLDMLIKYEVTPIALEAVTNDYFFNAEDAAKTA